MAVPGLHITVHSKLEIFTVPYALNEIHENKRHLLHPRKVIIESYSSRGLEGDKKVTAPKFSEIFQEILRSGVRYLCTKNEVFH